MAWMPPGRSTNSQRGFCYHPELDLLALLSRPCDIPCLIAVDHVFFPGFFHARFKTDGVVGTPA